MKNSILKSILFVFALTIILPIVILVIFSFTERYVWPDILPSVFSFRSFRAVFSGNDFAKVLFTSVLISFVVAVISTVISIFTARAIIIHNIYGERVINLLAFMPLIVPSTVFALGINTYFIKFGLAKTIFGIIIAHTLYSQPYSLKLIFDAVRAIGDRFEIAAKNLGATNFIVIKKVTVPMLFDAINKSMAMSFIISFSQYFLTLIIGGGKVKVLNIIIVPFLQSGDRNIASLYSLLFLGITMFMIAILNMFLSKKDGQYFTI